MVKHYSDLLSVFYLSYEFVGFYYLLVVKLHLLITWVCTCWFLLSQRFWLIGLQMTV